MSDREQKSGHGAKTIVLLILGMVVFGVFQYPGCVFFSEPPVEQTTFLKVTRTVTEIPAGANQATAEAKYQMYAVKQREKEIANEADIASACKSRFIQRKEQVLDLYDRGLLDAYGLSDIGALSNYEISTQSAAAVQAILEANGLHGLQNGYDGVAHAVCTEVAHDEAKYQIQATVQAIYQVQAEYHAKRATASARYLADKARARATSEAKQATAQARQGQRGVASRPNYAARQSPSKADIVRACKSRFAQRKNQVLGLYDRRLLDAYGLSDIGVLSRYGISIQAARAVLDILEANGSYGLQNDYNGVAHAVRSEVAHDEVLINDGTREPFVNR